MEKHIQTFLLSIITALVIGIGGLIWAMRDGQTETNGRIVLIQYQVQELSKTSGTFVTKDQLDARSKLRDQQLQSIDQRLSRVEQAIDPRKVLR